MSNQDHVFILTNKQEAKLNATMQAFYARALESTAVSGPMLLLIAGVHHAILEGESLEQYQMDVVLWILELIFAQMEDEELDPALEQLYHKLSGWWPVEPPWYERIKDFDLQGELKK